MKIIWSTYKYAFEFKTDWNFLYHNIFDRSGLYTKYGTFFLILLVFFEWFPFPITKQFLFKRNSTPIAWLNFNLSLFKCFSLKILILSDFHTFFKLSLIHLQMTNYFYNLHHKDLLYRQTKYTSYPIIFTRICDIIMNVIFISIPTFHWQPNWYMIWSFYPKF